MTKLDPKVKNLLLFLSARLLFLCGLLYSVWNYAPPSLSKDPLRLIGLCTVLVLLWRACLSLWRRYLSRPKSLESYGKWAIITGSTSGIGAEFSLELASLGLNILLISRSEVKLEEQQKLLIEKYGVEVRYIAYDFTRAGAPRTIFYERLNEELFRLQGSGGVGVLINNVGTANEIPRKLEEFTDEEVEDMLQCNIFSQVYMTRAVVPYMRKNGKGCIISISSGSGNHVGPFLAVYSATKAFMTQFSRSLSVESWDTGIDYLVVTPFYIVSNLFKRKSGTIIAPMPSVLVKGTLQNVGKKWVWQTHGYWFHGAIGAFATYWWGMCSRYRKMMLDNRKRSEEKLKMKN